ncbi:hypothetical protein EIP91_006518 [Steccherinum ochraceum]|uniref:Uncharacterized protein n=1 Tax=Steccherinum ochraceum TaxID=92696 RepID=A0A4R0R5I6_9APHY|nr:hypothetical protein EIP91_006518 [Steccherinum ochraceum]
MNRRNKAKGGAQSALKPASITKPASPTPAPPKPSAAPPAPTTNPVPLATTSKTPSYSTPSALKPTSSELVRREWKAFQPWLQERRAERDKQIAEARAPAKSIRSVGYNRKPPSPSLDANAIAQLENKLTIQLCRDARAEWEKRLAVKRLREEEWVDITQAEMNAVEDAFMEPQAIPDTSTTESRGAGKYGMAGNSLSGNTTSLANEQSSWNTANKNRQAQNSFDTASRNSSRFGDVTNQQSGWASGDSASRQDFQPTAASGQDESLWNAAISGRKTPAPSQAPLPAHPEPEEGIWGSKMRGSKPNTASSKVPPSTTEGAGDSMWNTFASNLTSGFGFSSKSNSPSQPEESAWDAQMQARNKASVPMSRSTSSFSQDNNSPWDSPASMARSMSASSVDLHEPSWQQDLPQGKSRNGNRPVVSSPLASYVSQASDASSDTPFRLISPTAIELEDGEHVEAGFDGLSQDQLDASIRAFYAKLAEVEIDLRGRLCAPAVSEAERAALLAEFTEGMVGFAREVCEDWKERQRLAAERRAAEPKKPLWGAAPAKRSQTPAPPPAPAIPATTANKKPVKKGGKKQADSVVEPARPSEDASRVPGGFWGEDGADSWSSSPQLRSSSPAPTLTAKKNPFGSVQSTNSWSAPKKPSGLGKATVMDEDDEEDEEEQEERIFEEKRAAEAMASPFKWMNADPPRSNTPKPDPQLRQSAQNMPRTAPSWGTNNANKPSPQGQFWVPGSANDNYGGAEEDNPQDIMQAAMRDLRGEEGHEGVFSAMSAYTTQATKFSRQETQRKRTNSTTKR